MRCGFILIAAVISGCSMTSWFVQPTNLPPVATDQPRFQVLPPQGAEAEVHVERVCRGTRGGVLLLAIGNRNPAQELVYDWQKLSLRLGNGQFRECVSRSKLDELCREFPAEAYGLSGEETDASWRWPVEGEVVRIAPGMMQRVAVPFGAGADQDRLALILDEAITHAETGRPLHSPIRVLVMLPPVLPCNPPPAWWPRWLHFNAVVTGGA